jgi:hypothetical protein
MCGSAAVFAVLQATHIGRAHCTECLDNCGARFAAAQQIVRFVG